MSLYSAISQSIYDWTGVDLREQPSTLPTPPIVDECDNSSSTPMPTLGYCDQDGGDIYIPVNDVISTMVDRSPDLFNISENIDLNEIGTVLQNFRILDQLVDQTNNDHDDYVSETEFLGIYTNPLEYSAGKFCVDQDAFNDFHSPNIDNDIPFSFWKSQGVVLQELFGYQSNESIQIVNECTPDRNIFLPKNSWSQIQEQQRIVNAHSLDFDKILEKIRSLEIGSHDFKQRLNIPNINCHSHKIDLGFIDHSLNTNVPDDELIDQILTEARENGVLDDDFEADEGEYEDFSQDLDEEVFELSPEDGGFDDTGFTY